MGAGAFCADAAEIAGGRISLRNADTGDDFSWQGSLVEDRAPQWKGVAIDAERVRVGGSARFIDGTGVVGEVNFSSATIGRDVQLSFVTFDNPDRSVIYAKDMNVRNVRLSGVAVFGNVRFERLEVGGTLRWRENTLHDDGGQEVRLWVSYYNKL